MLGVGSARAAKLAFRSNEFLYLQGQSIIYYRMQINLVVR